MTRTWIYAAIAIVLVMFALYSRCVATDASGFETLSREAVR